jgi:hypothetical protein
MRHRDLAAIAVAATVAATPALATVIDDLATAPPAAAADAVPIGPDCSLNAPHLATVPVVQATLDPYKGCKPGTFSLQSSADHSHWKTLTQTHQTSWVSEPVLSHVCLAGTSWYQGYFVADDGSFKGGTDSAFPTQFTC